MAVELPSGSTRELIQRKPRKQRAKIESAANRRNADVQRQTFARQLVKQRPGRPPAGSSGPRPGSVRDIAGKASGLQSVSSIARAGTQFRKGGEVRDGRRNNRSEAMLTEWQLEAILGLIYRDFEQRYHVNYEKVGSFAVRVLCVCNVSQR